MQQDDDEAERWARFGNALAEALPKSRLRTQKALAAHLGVDQTMVSAWKRGKKLSRMTPTKVAKLERALGPEVCKPGALAAILFGPATISSTPDQLEERLASIDKALAAQSELMAKLEERLSQLRLPPGT